MRALPLLLLALGAPPANPALVRQAIAAHALAQVDHFDPAWTPEQRDCAGFVRFVYREAWKQLEPARATPLWRDRFGKPSDFADAENLLAGNFALLGRGAEARAQVQTGDLVAFRQGEPGAEVFHLMLVVHDRDPAHGAMVLYHPGEPGAALRGGSLTSLAVNAPLEWRPVPENPAFLGFYRLKEWAHEPH
ncbi:MAG: DUF1175 family protein [Deltaproteobacteria bacterium]|nr:DUF1175 family protein [Deltaproteobacteria bacterium]